MKYIICCLLLLSSVTGCTGQGNTTVFAQKKDVVIQRFDKELHDYLSNPTPEKQRIIGTNYKDFLPAFGRITINNSDSYKPEFFTRLQRYFSNEMLAGIYNDALKTFDDVSQYEKELSYADDLISTEFEGKRLPALYMHVSGFKENVMVLDNILSISIDKYLGMDYPVYKQFFESFQLIQMQPEMVTRDYLKAWLLSEIIPEKKNPNLLEEMVKEGKMLYALSLFLPEKPLNDLLGYTAEQEDWCKENEKQIWQAIVSNNHLYEQNQLLIGKYINEAPYTATLTPESPGRVGAWVGWNIVNAYMTKNKVLLSQLMKLDAQTLLKESGYNP